MKPKETSIAPKTQHTEITIAVENPKEALPYFLGKLEDGGAEDITYTLSVGSIVFEYDVPIANIGQSGFEDMVGHHMFCITNQTPPIDYDDENVIVHQDILSASYKQNGENDYTIEIKLDKAGTAKLAKLSRKYSGGHLTIWLDYKTLYIQNDLKIIDDGTFYITDITNEMNAADLTEFFNMPTFKVIGIK